MRELATDLVRLERSVVVKREPFDRLVVRKLLPVTRAWPSNTVLVVGPGDVQIADAECASNFR